MAEQIIARLINQQDACVQWLLVNDTTPSETQQGTLQDLANIAKNRLVTLLLPASDVLLLALDLPVKTSSQIKKALPFALDDLLADDVETYHLVWHRHPKDKVYVAAISHDKFQACLLHFLEVGIELDSVYPETLCLPYQDQSCSILIDRHNAILRSGQWLGGGIDVEILPAFVDKLLEENPQLQSLQVWDAGAPTQCLSGNAVDLNCVKPSPAGEGWVTTAWTQEVEQRREQLPRGNQRRKKADFYPPHPNLLPEGEGAHVLKLTSGLSIDTVQHQLDSPLRLLLAGAVKLGGELNLLSGHYSRKNKADWQWKKWLPALGVVLLAALIQTGGFLNGYWKQKSELTALETQTLALFKQTFPDVKRVVNIKVQAEQQLTELKKQSSENGSLFMRLLYQSGEVLSASPGFQLRQLDFVNDILQLQLTAPDISQVEQFKQQLESSYELSVKVQSAEAGQNAVEAHLEIREK